MNKIFEQLVEKRGISQDFLSPKYENLTAPENLPDMKKAIKRIIQAAEKQEKVLIYGDYDVDGVTASTIMYDALTACGITEVETMLPDRFIDGYGMSERVVERAEKDGISLVVTVDCGSNNSGVIDELTEKGVDVIVTDHHELSAGVPEKAIAVVNPKRADFRKKILAEQAKILDGKQGKNLAGLQDLAGAGVAFMVAKALVNAGKIKEGQEKWLLDLAMIGTICDSMLQTHDNRIICFYGMKVLAKTRRPGLLELMRVSGVKKLNSEAIGFQIGPRLNAAGRMETATLSLRLLMSKTRAEAAGIVAELDRLNSERKKQQQTAMREIKEQGVPETPVIVVSGKWHEGILGIIAGRLTERYKRPSFVLTEMEDGFKGSGRSFGEFNLALALSECQKCLVNGGGHAGACGLKVKHDMLDKFITEVNTYYKSLKLKNQERFLDVAADIMTPSLGDFSLDLLEEMGKLEPYGDGNSEPVFLLRDMFVLDARKMGTEQNHLRLLVRGEDEKTMKLVAFFAPEEWLEVANGAEVNLWVNVAENEWNGTRSVEGRIVKLEYARNLR